MDRRQYLALVGTGSITAIAGCTGSDDEGNGNGNADANGDSGGNGNANGDGNGGSDGADDSGNGDAGGNGDGNGNGEEGSDGTGNGDSDGNGDSEESGEPSFEIESLDMPEEVEVGEEWSWSVTIANTGDGDGTFQTSVLGKTADSEYSEVGTIDTEIAAGETATYESDTGRIDYLTRVTYRFEALDAEHEISVVSRSLAFGESYENPRGIVTTAHGVELKDHYTYEDFNGDEATEEASSGNQWAFVDFEAVNESGSSESAPYDMDIVLISENSQFDPAYIQKEDGKYEGGDIQDGITRHGWIVYEIPAELAVSDLEVAYSEQDFNGEWSVRWRPE